MSGNTVATDLAEKATDADRKEKCEEALGMYELFSIFFMI